MPSLKIDLNYYRVFYYGSNLRLVATRVFNVRLLHALFQEITFVGSDQRNYFKNANVCSKRTMKTRVATRLNFSEMYDFLPNHIFNLEKKNRIISIKKSLFLKMQSWDSKRFPIRVFRPLQNAVRRKVLKEVFYIFSCRLNQWFSILGSWRPTKHNNAQLGDPYVTIILLSKGFGDPKVSARDPKVGREPPVEKHWLKYRVSQPF